MTTSAYTIVAVSGGLGTCINENKLFDRFRSDSQAQV